VTPGSAFRAGSGAHRSALALPAGVRKRIRLRDALTYSVVGLARRGHPWSGTGGEWCHPVPRWHPRGPAL